MPSPKVDLGIRLERGWPVHQTECDDCLGRPYLSDNCDGCRGRGYLEDLECECVKCVALAKAEQKRRDAQKKWRNAG